MPKRGETWIVRVDGERCSLCEICTRRCPTGALRVERDGPALRLLFEPLLCGGCGGDAACELGCAERALRCTAAAAEDQAGGPVTLVEDELVRCSSCQRLFAPARKLRAVQRRRGQRAAVERCPACRRAQLVVRFIDDRSQAETAAAHRSARDILRRAGHWLDD